MGLIAGLIKENQWLISPDHKAFWGGYLRWGWLTSHEWWCSCHQPCLARRRQAFHHLAFLGTNDDGEDIPRVAFMVPNIRNFPPRWPVADTKKGVVGWLMFVWCGAWLLMTCLGGGWWDGCGWLVQLVVGCWCWLSGMGCWCFVRWFSLSKAFEFRVVKSPPFVLGDDLWMRGNSLPGKDVTIELEDDKKTSFPFCLNFPDKSVLDKIYNEISRWGSFISWYCWWLKSCTSL